MLKALSFFLLFCCQLSAQTAIEENKIIDSLNTVLRHSKDNCQRAEVYYLLGKEEADNEQNDLALNYGKKALAIAKELNCKKNLTLKCYNLVATAYDDLSNYTEAQKYYAIGLDLAQKNKDYKYVSVFYTNIGECYRNQDNFAKALESYMSALKIDEEMNDSSRITSDYFTLTLLYSNIEDNNSFKKYLFKTIEFATKLRNEKIMAKCYNMYGIYQGTINNLDSSEFYYYKALDFAKKTGILHLEAKIYANLSDIFLYKKDIPKTIEYINKSIAINEQINNLKFLVKNHLNLGFIYNSTQEYNKALKEFFLAETLCGQRFADSKIDIYRGLSLTYNNLHDYNKAFLYQSKFITLKDSIYNLENSKLLSDIKTNFEVEKKTAELKAVAKVEKEKVELIAKEEKKKQNMILFFILCGLAMLSVFTVFIYRGLQRNKKANRIISQQKKEVELQKFKIEEKQKEVMDSITYARHLQQAILPSLDFIQQELPNSFILYKPKEMVAGDFYWCEKIGSDLFIAAADSTGHGVPGALVSVVCSNALNRSIKEFHLTETGEILDKTRELVLDTFAKNSSDVKDGMDISLLRITSLSSPAASRDKNKGVQIQWSGANLPLWYIQNGEFKEIGQDKQSIGKTDHAKPFITHTIELNTATTFYLFTDGFADQFGGPKGKKFKYKQLEKTLAQYSELSFPEQKMAIDKKFEEWKGELEQVDDVCVIGIRI